MESPPPYRQKKSNTGLIVGLIIGAVVVCCLGPLLAVGGLGYFGLKQGVPMITCAIAIEDLQKSLKDYADAHNGKLPPAKTWQTDIKEFYVKESAKNRQENSPIKIMPADGEWGCVAGETQTGFAYNSNVAGKKLSDLDGDTIVIFEVAKRSLNQAMPYKPQDPKTSPKIMTEHRGWFVAPVDGDAHLLSPDGKSVKIDAHGASSK